MSKFEKLAVLPILTFALLGTSYASSVSSDLHEGGEAVQSAVVSSAPLRLMKTIDTSSLPCSAGGRRYGFLRASTNSKTQEFLSNHQVTQNGARILDYLTQGTTKAAGAAGATKPTTTTTTTPTPTLPTSYDMRTAIAASISAANALFPVYDQGLLGSCTANASSGAVEYCQHRDKMTPVLIPSRLSSYYYERSLGGTISYDSGSTIANSIAVLISPGVMSEGNWSYTDQTTTCWLGGVFANGTTAPFIQKPVGTLIPIDTGTLATAKFTQTGTALGTAVQTALSQNHPVVIGIEVYESFESDAVAASGIVPMPSSKDTLLGGHALMLVGFNTNMSYTLNGKTTTGSFFIFRNSWGSGWGASGYGYLPAAYLESSSLTSEVYLVTAS